MYHIIIIIFFIVTHQKSYVMWSSLDVLKREIFIELTAENK